MKKILLAFAFLASFQAFCQAPINDICANAIELIPNSGLVAATNLNTVTEGTSPNCGIGAGAGIKDVWYKFIFTGGTFTVTTTLGTLSDTRMALYSSCTGAQLLCNDDAAGLGYASQFVMSCPTLTVGTTYYIQVGGYNNLQGNFSIQLTSADIAGCTDPSAGNYNACATVDDGFCNIFMPNETCATAVEFIPNSGAIITNNNNVAAGPTPGCGGTIRDIWYYFVYQGGNVTIQTSATTGSGTGITDTQIAVYNACNGSIIACDDDDNTGNFSMIKFGCPVGNGTAGANEDDYLTIGQTYYVQVGGYNSTMGEFNFNITTTTVSGCTNANATNFNSCATIDDGTCEFPALASDFNYYPSGTNCMNFQFNNTSVGNATSFEWTFPSDCVPSTSTLENPTTTFATVGMFPVTLTTYDPQWNSNSVTLNVIVTNGHNLTVDITADNLPQQTSWKVFNQENLVIQQGTSNDANFCISNNCHRVEIYDTGSNGLCCANGNGNYNIYLDGNSVATGTAFGALATVQVNCPQGTSCDNAIVANLGLNAVPAPNTWYSFTPSVNGQYQVSTCGLAGCDTKIWLYDYCNMALFDNSVEATYTYNDDLCGIEAEITPYLEGGVTYFVRVGDEGGACGLSSFQVLFEYMGPIVGCMDLNACNYSPLAEAPSVCYYNGDPNCSNVGPDLLVEGNVLYTSLYQTTLTATDGCLVNEGCLQGLGTRQIVRFSTRIDNIGNLDYFIGVPNVNNPQFIFDPCHNHYHYSGYAEYLLYDNNGNLMPEIGFKNGFCVLDLGCVTGVAKYGCGNMGITAGCYDVYSSGLSCQWIDITNVPAGTYHLVVRTNWDQDPDALGNYELRYDNNWAQVCISFERDAMNNIINFVKLPIGSCPEIVDCVGQLFGNAQPDCLGNCPAETKKGDLNEDLSYTQVDVDLYGNSAVYSDMSASICNDLNSDGDISIADAAYLEECIHAQIDAGVIPGNMQPCGWDPEIVDASETVTLGVTNVNAELGYFDVTILNPNGEVNGLQFDIGGATITNVTSLLPITTWSSIIYKEVGGVKIGALGHLGSMIPVHFTPTPILRVYVENFTGNEICIAAFDEALNIFTHNVLTEIGPCLPVQYIAANATFSNVSCVNYPVHFIDNTNNNPTTWNWIFEGGVPSTSNLQNPYVMYTAPGTYNVTLMVTNGTANDSVTWEGAVTVSNEITYYQDSDGDGFGDPQTLATGCEIPSGYVTNGNDCNDNSSFITTNADLDGDGYFSCADDCNDGNALSYPGAMELCNNLDDNCDGTIDEGFDADGDGYSACAGDCDDNNAGMNPNATEFCNDVDDNCNGAIDEGLGQAYYMDIDGDGYGAGVVLYSCTVPTGAATNNDDCNDANPAISPSAVETVDEIDNDCDGYIDETNIYTYTLNEIGLNLFPNPTSSDLNIELNAHAGNVSVQVKDVSGKNISNFQFNSMRYSVDVSEFAPGLYEFIFRTENSFTVKRVVVE